MQKSDSFLYEVQHNLVRCNKHSKWNHRKFSGFKQKEVTCLHSINCRHSLLPFCFHKRCHFGAHMVLKSSAIVLLVVRNIWTKNSACFSLTEKNKKKRLLELSLCFLAENSPRDTSSSVWSRAKCLNMNWIPIALAFSGCPSRLGITSPKALCKVPIYHHYPWSYLKIYTRSI